MNLWYAGIGAKCLVPFGNGIRDLCKFNKKFGKVSHHGFLNQTYTEYEVENILEHEASGWQEIQTSKENEQGPKGKKPTRVKCVPHMVWTNENGVRTLSYAITDMPGGNHFEHISIRLAANGLSGFDVDGTNVTSQETMRRFRGGKKLAGVHQYMECLLEEVRKAKQHRKLVLVPGPNEKYAEKRLHVAHAAQTKPRIPYMVWFDETSDGNVETVLSCRVPKAVKGRVFQHVRISQDDQDSTLKVNGVRLENEYAQMEPGVYKMTFLREIERTYNMERQPIPNVAGLQYDKETNQLVTGDGTQQSVVAQKQSLLRRISFKLNPAGNQHRRQEELNQKLEKQFLSFIELDNETEVDEKIRTKTLLGDFDSSSTVDRQIKKKPSLILRGANPGRSTETDDFDDVINKLTMRRPDSSQRKRSLRRSILPGTEDAAEMFTPDNKFAQTVSAKWSSHLLEPSTSDDPSAPPKFWNHVQNCYQVAVEREKDADEALDNIDLVNFENDTGNGGYLEMDHHDDDYDHVITVLNDQIKRPADGNRQGKREKAGNNRPAKKESTADRFDGFEGTIDALKKHGDESQPKPSSKPASGEFAAFHEDQFRDEPELEAASITTGGPSASAPIVEGKAVAVQVVDVQTARKGQAKKSKKSKKPQTKGKRPAPPAYAQPPQYTQKHDEAAKVIQNAFRSFLNDGTLVNKQRKFGRQVSSYFSHRLLPIVAEAHRKHKQEQGKWNDAKKTWIMIGNVPTDCYIDLNEQARLDEDV